MEVGAVAVAVAVVSATAAFYTPHMSVAVSVREVEEPVPRSFAAARRNFVGVAAVQKVVGRAAAAAAAAN